MRCLWHLMPREQSQRSFGGSICRETHVPFHRSLGICPDSPYLHMGGKANPLLRRPCISRIRRVVWHIETSCRQKWHATLPVGTYHSDFMPPPAFWTPSTGHHPRANKEGFGNVLVLFPLCAKQDRLRPFLDSRRDVDSRSQHLELLNVAFITCYGFRFPRHRLTPRFLPLVGDDAPPLASHAPGVNIVG